MIVRTAVVAAVMLAAACSPRPTPAPPAVVRQHKQPAPDWFHQQLAAAAKAQATHQPAGDAAGAQKAYDDIVQAACIRLALAASEKYPARCDAVLRHALPPPASDRPGCDDAEVDPAVLKACND